MHFKLFCVLIYLAASYCDFQLFKSSDSEEPVGVIRFLDDGDIKIFVHNLPIWVDKNILLMNSNEEFQKLDCLKKTQQLNNTLQCKRGIPFRCDVLEI